MAKQLQLAIPVPCHEDWDKMTTADKGKFCASCQKQVVDFTNMSDRQVAEFFKKPSTGSVCGRFMSDQLERDIEIPKKRIPFVKYFFQIALPAFLFSLKATAQKKSSKPASNNIKSNPRPAELKAWMMGDVEASLSNRPLIGDTIVIPEGANKGLQKQNDTTLQKLLQGRMGCGIVPFKQAPPDISTARDLKIATAFSYERSRASVFSCTRITLGGVSTVRTSKRNDKPGPLISLPLKDTMTGVFKIFPNPVQGGSSINIEWKEEEEGYYTLQLISLAGQAVHQKEIWIDAGAKLLSFEVPVLPMGNYHLVFTNKDTGKKLSQAVIIE
jgi:hypothetical protein